MRKFYLVIIAIMAISSKPIAQTTYTWVGGSTGDYTVAANWSPLRSSLSTSDILAFNVSSLIAVTNTPTQTVGAIQIAAWVLKVQNFITRSHLISRIGSHPISLVRSHFGAEQT